jgi:excisionase family DNA binding protein
VKEAPKPDHIDRGAGMTLKGSTQSQVVPRYSVREAADQLGLGIGRTRQLIYAGRLGSVKEGPHRYVSAAQIETYISEKRAHEEAVRKAAPTSWDWEGNLVKKLERWLVDEGWTVVSRADAALRERGNFARFSHSSRPTRQAFSKRLRTDRSV